jgi:hypothetical protein
LRLLLRLSKNPKFDHFLIFPVCNLLIFDDPKVTWFCHGHFFDSLAISQLFAILKRMLPY